jgi:hypothetical protein
VPLRHCYWFRPGTPSREIRAGQPELQSWPKKSLPETTSWIKLRTSGVPGTTRWNRIPTPLRRGKNYSVCTAPNVMAKQRRARGTPPIFTTRKYKKPPGCHFLAHHEWDRVARHAGLVQTTRTATLAAGHVHQVSECKTGTGAQSVEFQRSARRGTPTPACADRRGGNSWVAPVPKAIANN